jgi:hypothetical protein
MEYLRGRLRERSTWLAIITAVGTIAGWELDPVRADVYAGIGMSLATAIGVLTREKKD